MVLSELRHLYDKMMNDYSFGKAKRGGDALLKACENQDDFLQKTFSIG